MAPRRSSLLLLSLLLSILLHPLASAQQQQDDEEAAADRITSLPGFAHSLPSRHYAGYVRVGGGDEGEDADADAGADEDEAAASRRPVRNRAAPARNLFYYLVESERDPAADPVVLWLNGGPGCSSFDAFVYEHGPFLFSSPSRDGVSDGGLPSLRPNPFSWSKVATVIYLDSPANVGLSFVDSDEHSDNDSNDSSGVFRTNDTATAADADAFLRGFFSRHPRLLSRPFFITGESYAGIYVPNLARAVVRNNAAGIVPRIDLRGYAVGNGCTDAEYDGDALPPFLAGRGLLPLDEFARLSAACNGSFWDADGYEWAAAAQEGWRAGSGGRSEVDASGAGDGNSDGSSSIAGAPASVAADRRSACGGALGRATRVLDGVNVYDVLDLCHASHRPREQEEEEEQQRVPPAWARVAARSLPPGRFEVSPMARVAALRPGARVAAAAATATAATSPPPPSHRPTVSHNPPCTSATLAEDWLNNDAVRRAIHAAPILLPLSSPSGSRVGGGRPRWTLCSDRIHYTHDAGSMLPVHAELLPGLPGWPKMLARAGLRREAERAWARRAEWAAAGAVAAAADPFHSSSSSSASSLAASPPPPPRLRALIYTGDHDAAVPSTGSEAWTTDMGGGEPLEGRAWRAWRVRRGTDSGGRPAAGEDAAEGLEQVGGYTREFPGGLTYATVRGAGHMVPTSKPLEALELLRRFLDGEELAPPAASSAAATWGDSPSSSSSGGAVTAQL